MKDFELDFGGDTIVVGKPSKARTGTYRTVGKRVFDIVVSILVLPVLAPLIFVLWVLVRRDGGHGFYSQMRVGMDGKSFRCWKLRTMVMDADAVLKKMCEEDPELAREWHENQKLADDPRITRIGRLLRATSMDELPQLWNIIRGEMSFVGPRPFMKSQELLYDTAGGRSYYSVRPGITGPWQVFGRGTTSFIDRVKYDNLYCREVSLLKDVFFIWKTVGVVLRRTGS